MTGPRSINRGMDVLHALAVEKDGLTLAELTDRLHLPKTSVLRLLRSFTVGDYVRLHNGRYVLGTETYKLVALIDRGRTFPDNLRPILARLAADTMETALIGVLRDDGYTIEAVDVVESARSLRYMTRTGDLTEGHASAMGQAIVAFLDESGQNRFFAANPFRKYSERTLNRREFRSALEDVRRTAVGRNIRGFDADLYGLACPVFDDRGHVACAVCVGGPLSRLDGNEERITALLLAGAAEMSRVLGLKGAYEQAAGMRGPVEERSGMVPQARAADTGVPRKAARSINR